MITKIYYIVYLCLISFIINAQNDKNISQKQQELKQRFQKKGQSSDLILNNHFKDGIKPIVISESLEYDKLKAEKKLAHYEIRMNAAGKPVIIRPSSKPNSPMGSPTPCDDIPYVGSPVSFGVSVDDANAAIALPFDFCYYGVTYNSCNVSINGNIQFSTNSTAFTSTGFPSTTVNMIAPFWADAYLTSGGSVKIDMYSTRMVVIWDSVGYFSNHNNLTNSFQCVLTDGTDGILPPGKNVGFYYKKMQWTTGDITGNNGFPDPGTSSPATVGLNEGNGVDYYLIGRFGVPGISYDGPLGADDGVKWLEGKRFYFNACPPVGANVEPVSTLIGYCDTMKVCGNDTLYIKNTFLAPEVNQSVSVSASAPTLGSSFSYSIIPNTNSSDIYMVVNGNTAPAGFHTITMTATDNGTPAQTSIQNYVVAVNAAAISNLNGSIIVTPTLGACPGVPVNASVIVTGGVSDSYLWNNNSTTSSITFTTVVAADSLIYVTLSSGNCQKTILGHVNINPVPTANITGNMSYCNGNALGTVLTATNITNPTSQGPHTYAWATSSGGSLSSGTTATTSVTGGVYTVTVTNQFGCKSSVSTTVTMNESPKYAISSINAISGGSVYCVNQDTARYGLNFGTGGSSVVCGLATSPCVVSNTFQVGTGNTNATGSATTPFVSFWESSRHQYLYRASELIAAGVQPGKISSIAFNLGNISSETLYPGFTVKIKCTSAASVGSAFDNTGLSQVYSANTTIYTGWNTLNFNQNYVWDGVSNILIDVCHGLTSGTPSNSQVKCTTTPFTSVLGDYDSGVGSLCGVSSGFELTGSTRPNMRFGNCSASQTGSQFNIVVTPATGVVIPSRNDSIMFDLPSISGTTCYTVSLINTIGGCSKDTIICVNALQGLTQATLSPSSSTICPGTPVTLSSVGTITSYTISYTDINGAQTSVNSPITFTPSATIGTFIYTLSAIGPCGGVLTDFTTTVNVAQGVTQATLSASNSSVCPGNPVTLSALGSLASYTITYTDENGLTQTSVNSSVTFNPASLSSPVFGVKTYTLFAEGPCSGPLTVFTNTVEVIQGVTQGSLSASSNSVCIGSPITLTSNGSFSTYTISYNNGSGVINSINNSATFNTTVSGINTYSLIGQGFCGAPITTFTTAVYVTALANLTIAPMSSVTKCANGTVILNPNVGSATPGNPGTPYLYSWTTLPGNIPAQGINNQATYTTTTIAPSVFVVNVSGVCASTVSSSVAVNIFTDDLFVSIVDTASVCAATPFSLNAVVSGGRPDYTYDWIMSGTNTSLSNTNPLVSNSPDNQGYYTVTVYVTDSCGYSANDAQVITVLPPCGIIIPNIITNNGDGVNDYFKIKNIEYHPNSVLTIFDRWGKKVYESQNYANDWNADKSSDGTYFYVLDVPDDKKYSGFITIFGKQ
ncbi:MAG: gliding motility-associated C-terminal domain-containing protein [Bacteroidia bacterium]|nr:gliding motility-associated C-terminal domain-containing protein [Bacteroidia bacterium]